MKGHICILAALFAAAGAIITQPLTCTHPDICAPRVITNCPNKNPIAECPTCCCNSTENVEFYNPDRREPRCTAPPAVYTVNFVSTWSDEVCHPDYYFSDAHWSPPTGASHNTSYQMWDACMDNVSPGVAQVSQIGATRLIEGEYEDAGDSILDTFKGSRIDGFGETSRDLDVDKDHQWVSVVTMLAPSRDRMAGVANLRLCDGHDWKPYVKVCAELFSTATRSERFHESMERNTIQWNNCSFGYFEFTFKEYEDSTQEPPKNCEFAHNVCPPGDDIPEKCRTCCCESSDNVHFFHPKEPPVRCRTAEAARYKVSLINHYHPECHPDYVVPPGLEENQIPYFTRPIVATHRPRRVMDTCNVARNILRVVKDIDHMPAKIIGDIINATQDVLPHIYALPSPETVLRYRRKKQVMFFSATPSNSYATIVSKLLPSNNTFVGVSGLNLCDGSRWIDEMEVCLELLAAIDGAGKPEVEKLQGNQCSFGKLVFELKSTKPLEPPERRVRGVAEEPTCTPLDGTILYNFTDNLLPACCYCEFIIEGWVIRTERLNDPKYKYKLVVRVKAVYYDEINQIKPGDVVKIKICSLPGRLRWRHVYRLTGTRECGSNELEISERGIFGDLEIGEGPCAPYIKSGNCDTPRP